MDGGEIEMAKQSVVFFQTLYPQYQDVFISVNGLGDCTQANYFETVNSTNVTHCGVKFLNLQSK